VGVVLGLWEALPGARDWSEPEDVLQQVPDAKGEGSVTPDVTLHVPAWLVWACSWWRWIAGGAIGFVVGWISAMGAVQAAFMRGLN